MDTSQIRGLYEATGPFVSVYLTPVGSTEDAAKQWEVRWKDLLRELTEAGVDERDRAALDAARGDHFGGDTRALVAAGGTVLLARWLPGRLPAELVRVGPLPAVRPLVTLGRERVPHVLVIADRTGADLQAFTGAEEVLERTVDSDAYPVHKTGTGGWAALRYEHTVENAWDETAQETAVAVADLAAKVGARVVLVAGDTRAVTLLEKHLPQHILPVLQIQGSRSRDGDEQLVPERVQSALEQRAAAQAVDLLGLFAQERGQHDRASDGIVATVEALRRAQVETLLLAEDVTDDGLLWAGPSPELLATGADELRDLGVPEPQRAPLVDVLVRAATGTGAQVAVVPAGTAETPAQGVGAVLRYSTR